MKPAFGPTLPALARRRLGVREPLTIAAVAALVAAFGFAMATVRPGSDPGEQLVHRQPPVFNLLYDADLLRPVDPRPGELARLEGERQRQSVAIAVRPLELPPYEGDVAHGLLPTYATGHIDRLRAELDGFRLDEEGRTRINDAPGYEVAFRAGPPSRRTVGTDVLLLPAEDVADGAVVLSFRREISGRGRLGEAGRRLNNRSRKAFRSFAYGPDPA